MNLYLDDDLAGGKLAALLRKAGHAVTVPNEIGTSGQADARHFVYAIRNRLVLLSRNHDDYTDLDQVVQASQGRHPGILVVRMDNDPTRDMTERGVVTAIRKLENAGAPIADNATVLNHWR